MSFIDELKRRNVFRVGAAYLIVAWLILQVADVVLGNIEAPAWVFQSILLLLVIGFPVALIFAWAYEMTLEGLKKEQDVDRSESITHATGRKLDFAIIGVLAIALILFAAERFVFLPGRTLPVEVTQEIVPTEGQQSIAVLPFVNMSSDPEQEYFSDGLSEELLNLLAKLPELKVIGRTSSFAFKGINEDLRIIGQALGVRTLLEGSVRKSGNEVRITAQLIDASDASHIWSETYDRTLTDIFAVQDEVAASIIDALQIHVGSSPSRGRPTSSADAYSNYLRAGLAAGEYDWRAVRQLCERAVDLDPSFAEAHELLAYSAWRMSDGTMPVDEAMALIRSASGSALAVNPDLVLAKALYRFSKTDSYSILAEIQAFDEAAVEQPNNPRILDSLFFNLFIAGYLDEALDIAQRLAEMDPLSLVANGRLPTALFAAGRVDDGFAALEIFDQLDPERTHWFYGEAHLAYGRNSVAIASFRKTLSDGGVHNAGWVADLVAGGRDPDAGQAYLDRRIPEIAASVPEDLYVDLGLELVTWYLYFGYVERYYDIIFDRELTSTLGEVGNLLASGIAYKQLGFTRHPRYLDVAEAVGIVNVWEQRGPPDFCEKTGGQWVCQ
jgi:TolB-like protein